MSDIRRFSSRRQRLDHAFLAERLEGAQSYQRIAGYFRSSNFELVGEELGSIPKVQVVCNSELDAADVLISKHARETALQERWNEAPTLTIQWQVELIDKLGIPSMVWLSNKKRWLNHLGHEVPTRGAEDVARCQAQIAIVSTGLIFQDSEERQHLLKRRFGTVVLDEAHKARRRGGFGQNKDEPNNLLDFMVRISARAKNVLLGTATPIQTEVRELWDLLRILASGADFASPGTSKPLTGTGAACMLGILAGRRDNVDKLSVPW